MVRSASYVAAVMVGVVAKLCRCGVYRKGWRSLAVPIDGCTDELMQSVAAAVPTKVVCQASTTHMALSLSTICLNLQSAKLLGDSKRHAVHSATSLQQH